MNRDIRSMIGRPAALAAAAAMAMVVGATAAGAESAHKKSPRLYDWHASAKAQPEKKVPRRAVASLRVRGSGSWACSPSGFGKRPVCRRQ